MNREFHIGTFLWGAVLALSGAALAAVGFGWWDISTIDLRYIAPLAVILVGTIIMVSALTKGAQQPAQVDRPV